MFLFSLVFPRNTHRYYTHRGRLSSIWRRHPHFAASKSSTRHSAAQIIGRREPLIPFFPTPATPISLPPQRSLSHRSAGPAVKPGGALDGRNAR